MDLINRTIGQYQIIASIGQGGMGAVFKAYQPALDRCVAIKVLPAQETLTPEAVARFNREARAVAQLDHPNILPIYDFGAEGELSYIVMKYVSTGTLKERMKQSLSLVEVLHLVEQMAAALDHAHERGILHRDVKPGNVLLGEKDWVLLADFGLAKLLGDSKGVTRRGARIGTPAYMSPEQGRGRPVTAATDIYSLGVILYQMVTGQLPYSADTPSQMIAKHVHEPLPPPRQANPAVPEAVEHVILKALAKDPAARFATAGDLVTDLRQAIATAAAPAAPLPRPAGPAAPKSRRPLVIGLAAGLVVLALLGFLSLAWWGAGSSARPVTTQPSVPATGRLVVATMTHPGPSATPGETQAAIAPTSTRIAVGTPTSPPSQQAADVLESAAAGATGTVSPTPAETYRLAFTRWDGSAHSIWLVGLDGSEPQFLLNYATSPSWSPDGRRLAFFGESGISGGSDGLWVMNTRGGDRQQLLANGAARAVAWSPTGNLIAFDAAPLEADFRVYFIDSNGTQVPAEILGEQPAWAPDGEQIVTRACRPDCSLWLTMRDGSQPRQLTGDASDSLPAWAPDGSRIAFSRQAGGNVDIYVLTIDSGQVDRLTTVPGNDSLPAWTPDSRQIVFRTSRSGRWQIYKMNADGSEQTLLIDRVGSSDNWAFERMAVHAFPLVKD